MENGPVTISPSNVASTVYCHPAKESLPPDVLFKAVLKVILDVFSWSLEKCTVSVRCVQFTLQDARCKKRTVPYLRYYVTQTVNKNIPTAYCGNASDVGDAFAHSLSWNAATFDGRSTETEREFFFDRYCTCVNC